MASVRLAVLHCFFMASAGAVSLRATTSDGDKDIIAKHTLYCETARLSEGADLAASCAPAKKQWAKLATMPSQNLTVLLNDMPEFVDNQIADEGSFAGTWFSMKQVIGYCDELSETSRMFVDSDGNGKMSFGEMQDYAHVACELFNLFPEKSSKETTFKKCFDWACLTGTGDQKNKDCSKVSRDVPETAQWAPVFPENGVGTHGEDAAELSDSSPTPQKTMFPLASSTHAEDDELLKGNGVLGADSSPTPQGRWFKAAPVLPESDLSDEWFKAA